MESISTLYFASFSSVTWEAFLGSLPPAPGIMFITCCIGPILFIISNWEYMSFRVNLPLSIASTDPISASVSAISSARSSRDLISPIPSNLEIKRSGSKASKSSTLSPVPMNFIGAPISATAERAPPPLAEPSNLVIIIEPILVVLLNARACSLACCPIVPSITIITSSGLTTEEILFISFNKSFSSLWRPAVSIIITSFFLNSFKPFLARSNASLFSASP